MISSPRSSPSACPLAFECLLRNTPSRFTLQSAAVNFEEFDAGNKMAIAILFYCWR